MAVSHYKQLSNCKQSIDCKEICNIIWPWLKTEYIEIGDYSFNVGNKFYEDISFTISFNKLTNFHYMIDSIDISIKEINSKPLLKIKTHAPYFSPEMKLRFNLSKSELKEKIIEIQHLLETNVENNIMEE